MSDHITGATFVDKRKKKKKVICFLTEFLYYLN